jgi:hypothetical protein
MTTTTETAKPKAFNGESAITDRDGREIRQRLTVGGLKQLAAILGHHPREVLTDGGKLVALLADPEKIVACVRPMIWPKVGAGVPVPSDEEFLARFDAAALDQAAEAVIRQLADMYAPRGNAVALADAMIAALTAVGEKAAGIKAEAKGDAVEQPAAPAA